MSFPKLTFLSLHLADISSPSIHIRPRPAMDLGGMQSLVALLSEAPSLRFLSIDCPKLTSAFVAELSPLLHLRSLGNTLLRPVVSDARIARGMRHDPRWGSAWLMREEQRGSWERGCMKRGLIGEDEQAAQDEETDWLRLHGGEGQLRLFSAEGRAAFFSELQRRLDRMTGSEDATLQGDDVMDELQAAAAQEKRRRQNRRADCCSRIRSLLWS